MPTGFWITSGSGSHVAGIALVREILLVEPKVMATTRQCSSPSLLGRSITCLMLRREEPRRIPFSRYLTGTTFTGMVTALYKPVVQVTACSVKSTF